MIDEFSLTDDGQSSFSGFSDPELENIEPCVPSVGANVTVSSHSHENEKSKGKSKPKSVVVKPKTKDKVKKCKKSLVDKLSEADLSVLKEKLGLNATVSDQISSSEEDKPQQSNNFNKDLIDAMFGSDHIMTSPFCVFSIYSL